MFLLMMPHQMKYLSFLVFVVSFDLGIGNKRNYSSQIEITLFQLSKYAVNLNKKSIIT